MDAVAEEIKEEANAAPTIGAVSYTHLDVYKRQTQCYFNVTNEKRMSYRQRRRYVTVDLTKMQYVELQALYDWHYKQLTKDMKRMQKEFTEACFLSNISSANAAKSFFPSVESIGVSIPK